ncbi:MAG: dolichyl-phosphate beta-glucosyltransferase [Anaerolineales bacterium]
MPNPFLSVIIPAFNEEQRLPRTLAQVLSFLQTQAYPSEILVIENASHDRTFQVADVFATQHHSQQLPIKVLREPVQGKGAAVKRGVFLARGEYHFMCDADLSMPVEEINRFLPPILDEFDIAIASREAPGAVRYNEPVYRHMVGRVFNTLIRTLALPGLNDTQCGFKCFKSAVARELFEKMTITGWSFDVEILYLAQQHNFRIVEVAIPWYYNPDSHISVVKDSLQMALDIFKIRFRGRNKQV